MPYDEEKFIAGMKAGDPDAWRRAMARYGPSLCFFFDQRIGRSHDVEDALQETWRRAMTGKGTLKATRVQELQSWLFRIARNVGADHYRRAAPIDSDATIEVIATDRWGPERIARARAAKRAANAALHALPTEQRDALVDQYLIGKTQERIACDRGWSLGKVKMLSKRARDKVVDAVQALMADAQPDES